MADVCKAVEFKVETLFDKFSLDPATPPAELMRMFQTKPELRKELSSYIKILKDKEALALEALMSCRIGTEAYGFESFRAEKTECEVPMAKKIAAVNDFLRSFSMYSSHDEDVWKCFFNVMGDVQEEKPFGIAAKSDPTDTIAACYREASLAFLSEKLTCAIASMDAPLANCLLRALAGRNASWASQLRQVINDALSVCLETIPSRIGEAAALAQAVAFIDGADKAILTGSAVYPSFKFCCNRLAKAFDDHPKEIGPLLPELMDALRPGDGEDIAKCMVSWCLDLCNVANIEKNDYRAIHDAAEIIAPVKKQIVASAGLDDPRMVDLLIALDKLGPIEYEKFRNLLVSACKHQDLHDTLVAVATYIVSNEELEKYKTAYFNMLSKAVGFETELAKMMERIELYNDGIEEAKNIINGRKSILIFYNSPHFYTYQEWLRFIEPEVKKNTILTVENIEKFINTYYGLSILDEDIGKVFRMLPQVFLGVISLMEVIPENRFSSGGLNTRGVFLRDCLQSMPGNWSLKLGSDAPLKSVNFILESTVHAGRSTVEGTAKPFMDECDKIRRGERTTSSSSSNSSSGCYVATAVYGSYDCPQVWTLRRFRDFELAKSLRGRAFIRLYYAISPALVKWFGETTWFKALWKGRLDRLVDRCQAKGFSDKPYQDRSW